MQPPIHPIQLFLGVSNLIIMADAAAQIALEKEMTCG